MTRKHGSLPNPGVSVHDEMGRHKKERKKVQRRRWTSTVLTPAKYGQRKRPRPTLPFHWIADAVASVESNACRTRPLHKRYAIRGSKDSPCLGYQFSFLSNILGGGRSTKAATAEGGNYR